MCAREFKPALMRQIPANLTFLDHFRGLRELSDFSLFKKKQTQTQERNKDRYLCNYFADDLKSGFIYLFIFKYLWVLQMNLNWVYVLTCKDSGNTELSAVFCSCVNMVLFPF